MAKRYYFLNDFTKRQSQHRTFEHSHCGYRKFIPIRFEQQGCEEPRLALKRVNDIRQVGLDHELVELCTPEDAIVSGQTTMMKVDPTLYFIELVFKEGRQEKLGGKCGPYEGATPDWFCNPRDTEIDHAFKNGWSMLPFKFFDDKKDEKYNDFKICPYCRFNLRVWAKMDTKIQPGNQNGAMNSHKSERAYFKKVLKDNRIFLSSGVWPAKEEEQEEEEKTFKKREEEQARSYSEVKSGTCDSVSGRGGITDKATCESAARSLGFSDLTADEGSYSIDPPGCWLGSELNFNRLSRTTKSCSPDRSCLCISTAMKKQLAMEDNAKRAWNQ